MPQTQSPKAGERTQREKTYRVTLLVESRINVRAYDEIAAETEAIRDHKKWSNAPVYQARVQRRGFDTGFYVTPNAPKITKSK